MTGGVISLQGDNGATLDKDCNLSVTGCVEVTKPFKSHMIKYTIKKAPMPPIEGEIEGCEALKNIKDPTTLEALQVLSVPSSCPVAAGKICSSPDKKLNLSKYKNQLGMAAGTVDFRLEGKHDTGKTCVEINFTLAKEKRSG
ncbi:hypothetical protein HHI36_011378 [Cryptolaemus montrouzieri]|uniref:MD-2-related lipid-recognition domain-containing protein n=1 Tax=Cryptolaemus montrouzieri TaxID=559131 RepID=A0ABD2MLM5_9CUCU